MMSLFLLIWLQADLKICNSGPAGFDAFWAIEKHQRTFTQAGSPIQFVDEPEQADLRLGPIVFGKDQAFAILMSGPELNFVLMAPAPPEPNETEPETDEVELEPELPVIGTDLFSKSLLDSYTVVDEDGFYQLEDYAFKLEVFSIKDLRNALSKGKIKGWMGLETYDSILGKSKGLTVRFSRSFATGVLAKQDLAGTDQLRLFLRVTQHHLASPETKALSDYLSQSLAKDFQLSRKSVTELVQTMTPAMETGWGPPQNSSDFPALTSFYQETLTWIPSKKGQIQFERVTQE